MIEKFDEIKKQLSELSDVINKFKSEAVQLRIIELVLGEARTQSTPEKEDKVQSNKTKPRRRKSKSVKDKPAADEAKVLDKSTGKSKRSGKRAVATLNDLIEGDFFNEKRTIGDMAPIYDCDPLTLAPWHP